MSQKKDKHANKLACTTFFQLSNKVSLCFSSASNSYSIFSYSQKSSTAISMKHFVQDTAFND